MSNCIKTLIKILITSNMLILYAHTAWCQEGRLLDISTPSTALRRTKIGTAGRSLVQRTRLLTC